MQAPDIPNIEPEIETPPQEKHIGYVCTYEDLDKLLDDGMKRKFQEMFFDFDDDGNPSPKKAAWRMFVDGVTPSGFLARYGIDLAHPTVRDAVAFDLVKLDDPSVSNDYVYTNEEHIGYSTAEYERMLLNRNFRINLVNLDKEWNNITYQNTLDSEGNGERKRVRTIDRMYQGVRLSDTVLAYFNSIFNLAFLDDGSVNEDINYEKDIYMPYTSSDDFTTEVSLIPNTHPDFNPITSRAYYDKNYTQYKDALYNYDVLAIATFALVDSENDKNHTGQYLVKVQRLVEGKYQYIIARMDKDGKFCRREDGKPDIRVMGSDTNLILSVCEQDFLKWFYPDSAPDSTLDSSDSSEWTPVIREVPMVHSTTSSHYSIFRQRIPNYDLKYARHYIQFKTRLDGMELCLEQMERDIARKEYQCSYCLARETHAIQRLFSEFKENKEVMELVIKFYRLLGQYDTIYTKIEKLNLILNDKTGILNGLIEEYKEYTSSQMDQKLELGRKIKSIKLEIGNNIVKGIDGLTEKLKSIERDMADVKSQLMTLLDDDADNNLTDEEWESFKNQFFDTINESYADSTDGGLQEMEFPDVDSTSYGSFLDGIDGELDKKDELDSTVHDFYDIIDDFKPRELPQMDDPSNMTLDDVNIDTDLLHRMVLETEQWRGYMYNLAYELNQLRKMYVLAEDATIKVRRLVNNFREKIARVESEVWDEKRELRYDFSWEGISTAGIREIILLYDWYACNAYGYSYSDLGFANIDEFMSFRRKCYQISLRLRKNQYNDMLNSRILRVRERINELKDRIADRKKLKYDDKYGEEALAVRKDDEDEPWSLDKVKGSTESVGVFARADASLRNVLFSRVSAYNDPTLRREGGLGVFARADASLENTMPSGTVVGVVNDESITEDKDIDDTMFAADRILAQRQALLAQYEKDRKLMRERTVEYLKKVGIIRNENELEQLALRSKIIHNYSDADVVKELDEIGKMKTVLDDSIAKMKGHRKSIQKIIDLVTGSEAKIKELKTMNSRLFSASMNERSRTIRNRYLLDKLDNETKISELRAVVGRARKEHLEDFSVLERIRNEVDDNQRKYDKMVDEFKRNIGINEDTINELVLHIYNKYQEEILNNGNA